MKKIIVATTTKTTEASDLVTAAADLQVPLELQCVKRLGDLEKLRDTSLVYWRSGPIERIFPERSGRVTELQKIVTKVPVLNRGVIDAPELVYKSVQQAFFVASAPAASKLKSIDSFLCASVIEVQSQLAVESLRYPFIAKPNYGSRGEGIKLIHNETELRELSDQLPTLVLQNYIPNQGDYRVLVIGGVVHDVVLRQSSADSTESYLNNLSQGGKATVVADSVLREKLTREALYVAGIFEYTICGVDILQGVDGALYFLEVNSVPQWRGLSAISATPVAPHVVKTLRAVAEASEEVSSLASIRDYYMLKLPYLPVSLRFHFLSRLHLWSGKTKYFNQLEAVRESWWNQLPDLPEFLRQITDTAHEDDRVTSKVKPYRERAFRTHAKVRKYNRVFFKLIYDTTIFGGQRTKEVLSHFDFQDLQKTRERLLNDPKAVFELSTVAVNFLLFCEFFFANQGMSIEKEYFMKIAETEQLADTKEDIDARVYFYTHVIIGASRFYAESPAEQDRVLLLEMLRRVEQILLDNFTSLTLDYKCEFLVCAQICSYESPLRTLIFDELKKSLSQHGLYIVNRWNSSAQNKYKDNMETMEHTNVLAMLAFLGKEGV